VLHEKFSGRGEIKKDTLLATWAELAKEPVSSCLGMSVESSSLLVLESSAPVAQAFEALCQGYHRVLVTSGTSGKFWFLGQSDVVGFLWKNADKFKDVFKTEARMVGPPEGRILTINTSESAWSGYRALVIEDTTSAPVVDDDGKVVGELGYEHLRDLTTDEPIADLLLPAGEFLKKRGGGSYPPFASVRPSQTLGDVIDTVVKKRAHKVFIVNDEGKPTSVVSLTDIIYSIYLDKLQQQGRPSVAVASIPRSAAPRGSLVMF